jgi:acetyltransferase-like isoleucine patch superfamily enzyme
MIAKTAIIYPSVQLGEDVIVEDFCVIGAPFKGYNNETTVIGNGSIIRSHTVIYAGNQIGRSFQTGNKANIRELNIIGDNVSIGTLSVVEHHVVIEDNVRIHTQAFIPEYSILKKNCWIGPNVVLTNAKFPKSPDVKLHLNGPIVEESAKIGANSTILPALRIGRNALVGAGSVVTRHVIDDAIVLGNPAKFIRKIHY